MIDTPVDHAAGMGAARRRRERRLRAYLRYARMSVAMALTEANHHTFPRDRRLPEPRPRTTRRRLEWPGMRCTSSCLMKTPPGCCQGQSWTLGRRSGCSTPWSTRTTSAPSCRFSILLWCTSAGFLTRSCPSSTLSTCPRSQKTSSSRA